MNRVRKGPWTPEEDEVLRRYVHENGPRNWSCVYTQGLLPRCGKSCRLRWINKLRPGLKMGPRKISPDEEPFVINLQARFGNKWALIASYLPGRTDNDVKNFWSMRKKRLARLQRAPHRSEANTYGGSCQVSMGPNCISPSGSGLSDLLYPPTLDPLALAPSNEAGPSNGQISTDPTTTDQCQDATSSLSGPNYQFGRGNYFNSVPGFTLDDFSFDPSWW